MTQGDISVAGIVKYNKNILLGRMKKIEGEFMSERWHLPGGGKRCGESDKAALSREIMEEAGIEIFVKNPITTLYTPKGTEVRWYECQALTYNLNAGSELDKAEWVPRHDVLSWIDKEVLSIWPKEIKDYFR